MTADPDFQPSVPLPTDTIPLRERLVVGVAYDSSWGNIVVACQDGSMFEERAGAWYERPPIPGTPRHYQKLGKAMEG